MAIFIYRTFYSQIMLKDTLETENVKIRTSHLKKIEKITDNPQKFVEDAIKELIEKIENEKHHNI